MIVFYDTGIKTYDNLKKLTINALGLKSFNNDQYL